MGLLERIEMGIEVALTSKEERKRVGIEAIKREISLRQATRKAAIGKPQEQGENRQSK